MKDSAADVSALSASLRRSLVDVPPAARLVAVSGGRDSLTLLKIVAALHASEGLVAPTALHVHHGLDPHADRWAARVETFAAELGVRAEVLEVRVATSGDGLEAAARHARYAAFADRLGPGDTLLLAQHADDQVETVLLRLLRGSGPRGLRGMPASRPLGAGRLLRPWLAEDGARIERAARSLGLQWLEDPANGAPGVDRAYLRAQLLPQLRARWPGATAAVLRSADACAESEAALAASLPPVPAAGAPLALATLGDDPALRRAQLRAWFAAAGLPMPPRARLETLLEQLDAAADAALRVDFGDRQVRRHGGCLYLLARHRPAPRPLRIDLVPGVHDLGCGRLELLPAEGGGPALRRGSEPCEVRFRDGGERLRLPGRGATTLKRLLQEAAVPPWERERIPLLCAGAEVLAVADLAVCEAGLAPAGSPGLRVRWTPEGAGAAQPSVGSAGSPR